MNHMERERISEYVKEFIDKTLFLVSFVMYKEINRKS
jgi:hypothetical protein